MIPHKLTAQGVRDLNLPKTKKVVLAPVVAVVPEEVRPEAPVPVAESVALPAAEG